MLTDARNRLVPFDLTYEGFRLTGKAEIEPRLPATQTDDEIAESAEIRELYVDGKPADDLLNPRVEHFICERILESCHAV